MVDVDGWLLNKITPEDQTRSTGTVPATSSALFPVPVSILGGDEQNTVHSH
jgi:hypothetical protein